MNRSIKSILVLVCICAVTSLLMALTNELTAPIIEKNESAAANAALLQVMPEGKGFEAVDISTYTLPSTISEAYKEANGGYVFKMVTSGYSTNFVIMCGVSPDKSVSGALCLSSGETLGYEKTFGENMTGKNIQTVEEIDTVSGATKTTGAYISAVKDALNAAIILDGGSVDIRTEEEILADNLSAALPQADGAFTKLFIVEDIGFVDAVYSADNNTGYVYVVGEEFIAVDATGNILSETETDISEAVSKMLASSVSDIDITAYADMPAAIVSASVSATGNYIFDIKAAGFGISGDAWYNPSGEYIYIKISVTSEGKIIDCFTVSQKETDGIGSACADEEFYTQFNGKDESNFREIDAISGATITTNAYKTAVSRAFEALKILKGVE